MFLDVLIKDLWARLERQLDFPRVPAAVTLALQYDLPPKTMLPHVEGATHSGQVDSRFAFEDVFGMT